jgi:putative NADH-flavin reductase
MVGKQVVKQGLLRGHTIKAFGRNVNSLIDHDLTNNNFQAIKGYIFEEKDVLNATKGSDAIISVIGGAFNGQDKSRSLGMKNIITQMKQAGLKRIIALGGFGILNKDEQGIILDQPEYPEEYRAVGHEHLQAYLYLDKSDLDWTFVCAPNIINEDSTGTYVTNKNYPPIPDNGSIRAGDLATFMLDELIQNRFLKARVGISN